MEDMLQNALSTRSVTSLRVRQIMDHNFTLCQSLTGRSPVCLGSICCPLDGPFTRASHSCMASISHDGTVLV